MRTFITHAAARVDDIFLVDLYAGSGLYSLGHQRAIFAGAALSSFEHELPFAKRIFCESDSEAAKALRIRVNRYFRGNHVVIFDDRVDQLTDKFRSYVPTSKGSYKTATLCIVDPFSLDVPFNMLETLASFGWSFLMPYTFAINSKIDYKFCLTKHRDRVSRFLQSPRAVEKLDSVGSNLAFYKQLVKMHQHDLLMLGLNASLSVHKLDSGLMDIPMYYLGFFSRQVSAKSIQRDVQEDVKPQLALF